MQEHFRTCFQAAPVCLKAFKKLIISSLFFLGRSDGCQANGTGLTAQGLPCPEFNWMVPLLTSLYLLIGNLLLLNILIAIFKLV